MDDEKIMTAAEWASISAASRHKINKIGLELYALEADKKNLLSLLGECYRRFRFTGMSNKTLLMRKITKVIGEQQAESDYQNSLVMTKEVMR